MTVPRPSPCWTRSAGLRRGHPAARGRRRGVDPDRRTGSGHSISPRIELAAVERAYAVLAGAKGPAKLLRADRLRPRRRGLPDARGAAGRRYRARFRAGAAEPRSHRASMDSRPTNGWRRASSTGATSGRTTSPPRSICSVASRSMSPSERLMISASCSLQHVPYDVGLEDELAAGGAALARLRRAEAGRDRRPSPGR